MSSKLFVYVTVLRGYNSYESAEEQHCVYDQRHLVFVHFGVAQVGLFWLLVLIVHRYGPAEECQQSVLWWKGGVPTPHGIATMSCFVCVLQRGTRAPRD